MDLMDHFFSSDSIRSSCWITG